MLKLNDCPVLARLQVLNPETGITDLVYHARLICAASTCGEGCQEENKSFKATHEHVYEPVKGAPLLRECACGDRSTP